MANDISFDDLIPKQSTASTKGADVSFDDLVPTPAPLTPSASAPVEGRGGAAFGVYPKAGMKPNEVVSDVASNIVNTTGKSLLPTGAAFAGFSAGATVAAPYGAAATAATAPIVGPFAPVIGGAIVLGGGLGTAFAASGAAKKVQDMLEELVDPEGFEQRKLQQQRNPTSTFLTELGVGLIGTSPKTAVTAAQKLGTLSRLASTPTGQRAVSGGLQGSLEAGTELASEGEITPWKVAAATAAGAAMPGVNRLGQIPLAIGEKIGGKISSVLPGGVKKVIPDVTNNTDLPKVDPTSTPEEQAAVIEKLKKISAERNATVPVVEAAFRNKETGEVQRVGKAHDEQQKMDLADTHEQGFVDENGKFLTRKEAWNRTKSAGQIPEGQTPVEPSTGLRSQDLRNAGDERFLPTEELVVKPATDVTEGPKTREEFKTAINNKRADYAELQLKAYEADQAGQTQQAQEFRTQADAIAAEREQLYKDIPAATFKDAANPTGVEIQDHLWGVKNTGQAIQRMLSVPNLGTKSERLLLEALGKSRFIRSADFNLSEDPLMVDNERALGAYGIKGKHRIDFDKEGNVGTVIHEVVHAGTMKLMREGNSAAAKKLKALYDQFMKPHEAEYQAALAEKIAELGGKITIGQQRDFRKEWMSKKPYGFTNAEEFIAEALINKDMKQLLTSIESKEAGGVVTNMWNKIRDAIYEGLGVPQKSRTMLDDVLDNTMTLVKESRNFDKVKDAPSNVLASRLSQEIQDDLQRQGIAVAHSSPHKFGMFDWIKHALSGEGFMAFGAGSYHSTADATDRGYFKMAKDQLRNKLFEQNPELKNKYYYLKNDVDWKERQVDLADDRLKEFQQGDLAKAEYEARRTYEQYVQDVYDWHPDVDATDPMVRKMYEREIALSKQDLENVKQKEKTLEKVVNDRKIQAEQVAKEFSDLQTEVTNTTKAATYHSTFKAKPEELLDWNATKQSNLVNNVFEKLGVELETERLVWTKTGEDRYTATNKNGQELFLGRQDAGTEKGWYVVDAATGELLKTAATLEDAKSATKTGEQLYRELSRLFEPFGEGRAYLTDEEASHIGDVKASIALAEQGVAGNVHDAQGGTESKHRNYVVFDDTKLETNFVGLAQRPKPTKQTLTEEQIKKAGGFVFPLDTVAKEGDHAQSPWLMSDGKIVGTGQDHIGFAGNVIEGPLTRGYNTFMEQFGAIRASMFVDAVDGNYYVTLHLDKGQRLTSEQLKTLEDIQSKRGEPIKIMVGKTTGFETDAGKLATPYKEPISLEELKTSDVAPKTKVIKDSSEVPKSIKDMMREEREKLDPRNVKDEEDFYRIATDIYEKSGDKAAIEFYNGYKEYKKTWLEPVKETEKFVGINLDNKLAGERVTSNNKANILEIAKKDKVNLEDLTYKIDRGDKLDGAEKTIADKFRTLMDDLGKRALDAGVINGWHENYVARNVVSEGDVPPGALEQFMKDIFGKGEGGSGGSKTTTKYGEPRRLKTRADLLRHLDGINGWLAENGKNYRFKLKTDNLAEIYADYAHAVEKSIENKSLITNLKQVRNEAGESLIRPITKDDPLPHGWEVMDNSELAGYAVHPDLLPALKFVFDAGPGQLMQALGTVSQITKRINVVGSFFHAKSLMEVLSSADIPIWTPLKEAIVLPLVEKGVKAATGKELQLSAITKAVEQYKKGGVGDNVDKWIKEGRLQLDAPEDVARGILSSIGKAADSLIGKYGPKTRVLESSLSTVEKYTLGLFDKYTWDYLHTGGKLMVADAYLDRARLQAAKEGKPFDETAARIEISRFVNDSFGGLNWFDAAASTQNEFAKRMAMAAYSPAGRRGLQIVLFAPDWTISTLRAFSAALPSSLNPTKLSPVEGIKGMMNPTTKADYARLYQFKTALTYLTLINAINLMVANRPVWENKDPTRIEFPDGTSMQAMKHAMEPVHWIMDPDKTLSNKLGFIPKALMIGIAGTEYASPDAPKLVDRSALSRLKAAASGALPFQVSAAMSAPEGEGAKRALLGTMGFPVYGSTPEQRKLKAAERELQTKELAWKYRDKEIAAGREKMTPKHIKEGNTLRKRREEMDKKMGK